MKEVVAEGRELSQDQEDYCSRVQNEGIGGSHTGLDKRSGKVNRMCVCVCVCVCLCVCVCVCVDRWGDR